MVHLVDTRERGHDVPPAQRLRNANTTRRSRVCFSATAAAGRMCSPITQLANVPRKRAVCGGGGGYLCAAANRLPSPTTHAPFRSRRVVVCVCVRVARARAVRLRTQSSSAAAEAERRVQQSAAAFSATRPRPTTNHDDEDDYDERRGEAEHLLPPRGSPDIESTTLDHKVQSGRFQPPVFLDRRTPTAVDFLNSPDRRFTRENSGI